VQVEHAAKVEHADRIEQLMGKHMPARLVSLDDGSSILLDKPILLLGRHPECDIQVESRKVSRRHCCIAQVDDHLVVRDLASTNGIRVNGEKVQEAILKPGDELTLGNQRYRLEWDSCPEIPLPRMGRPAAAPPADPPLGPKGFPRRRTEIDDAALESCDQPIPLDEPEPVDLPLEPLGPEGPSSPIPPQPAAEGPILPDILDLAPSGDRIPGVSNPPSGS
jgi:predicted component of type VI protein secretion system